MNCNNCGTCQDCISAKNAQFAGGGNIVQTPMSYEAYKNGMHNLGGGQQPNLQINQPQQPVNNALPNNTPTPQATPVSEPIITPIISEPEAWGVIFWSIEEPKEAIDSLPAEIITPTPTI